MSRPGAALAHVEAEGAARTDVERAWLEAEVDLALEPFREILPDAELAFMREQLLAGADDELAPLVRAAAPREVDESGEVLVRKPGGGR